MLALAQAFLELVLVDDALVGLLVAGSLDLVSDDDEVLVLVVLVGGRAWLCAAVLGRSRSCCLAGGHVEGYESDEGGPARQAGENVERQGWERTRRLGLCGVVAGRRWRLRRRIGEGGGQA